jgi:hypothetical protein
MTMMKNRCTSSALPPAGDRHRLTNLENLGLKDETQAEMLKMALGAKKNKPIPFLFLINKKWIVPFFDYFFTH